MQTSDQINLVIAIATCISVFASLTVALLTMQISKSNRITAELMKVQLDASSRPYIQIGPMIRIGTPLIQLSIANTGQSNAENLRLELVQDFYSNAENQESRNLKNYTAFVHPISTFSPQTRLVFDLGTGPAIFNNANLCPHRFTVKVTYQHNGTEFIESTTIDLQPFRLTTVPHDPIADEIEKLRKSVEKVIEKLP